MNRVVNSTVLSNFAATQRLDLLRDTVTPLFLPFEVYEELQQGLMAGYTFYDGIEKHITPFTIPLRESPRVNSWDESKPPAWGGMLFAHEQSPN
jgi:hypothetical protein